MQYLFLYEKLIPIEALLLAFIITFLAIPSIVDVARKKHLVDVPNGRTSHDINTPTLGGLSIFAGFVISTMIYDTIRVFVLRMIHGRSPIFLLKEKE